MKLSQKDKEFVESLKTLIETKDLSIDLIDDGIKRLVLRQNYGDKVESFFGLSRQGIRWRFQRLFNEIYVIAYTTILWVESNFGTELRQMAMAIAKERKELRRKALEQNDTHHGRKGRGPLGLRGHVVVREEAYQAVDPACLKSRQVGCRFDVRGAGLEVGEEVEAIRADHRIEVATAPGEDHVDLSRRQLSCDLKCPTAVGHMAGESRRRSVGDGRCGDQPGGHPPTLCDF